MKNLTDSAQNRLDSYLNQARASLKTCTSVDADEVERDIKEHIETELEGFSEPVSLKDLEAVLDQHLGRSQRLAAGQCAAPRQGDPSAAKPAIGRALSGFPFHDKIVALGSASRSF